MASIWIGSGSIRNLLAVGANGASKIAGNIAISVQSLVE